MFFSLMGILCISIIAIFFGVRNERVYRLRNQLLDLVFYFGRKDIKQGLDWKWRYEEYDKVTYDEMFWKFWKPLKSFYKDYKFIEPSINTSENKDVTKNH